MANNSNDIAMQKYTTPVTELSIIRLKGSQNRKLHFTITVHTDDVDSALKTINWAIDKEKREQGILII